MLENCYGKVPFVTPQTGGPRVSFARVRFRIPIIHPVVMLTGMKVEYNNGNEDHYLGKLQVMLDCEPFNDQEVTVQATYGLRDSGNGFDDLYDGEIYFVVVAESANMRAATILGRASGVGVAPAQDLTATQATAILDAFVGDSGTGGTKGLVPAPAAGYAAANKFLAANGRWEGVGNAQLADMGEATIKGRASGAGTGPPQDLTTPQATAILDAFVGDSGAGGTKG